ncbi:MAG: N-acetylglucosamine-6-phosphate deacetylase [Clostridia bacterium]
MKIIAKRALLPEGWMQSCAVEVEGGRIVSIQSGSKGDLYADILTPGLLDKHQHGALGFDAAHPTWDACERWLRMLAQHGVTALLYTIGTGPVEVTRQALAFARQAMDAQRHGKLRGARILGAHLEGPFINPARKGAMAQAFIQPPSISTFEALTGENANIVRAVTLAPEMPRAEALTAYLIARGICVQVGHSDANVAQARTSFDLGATGVTHMFNAMSPISARVPGLPVEALLDERVYCEVVCDLIHVDARMLALLLRLKGPHRTVMISDSVATAGLPDGHYDAGNHPVVVRERRNYSESGSISGGYEQLDFGVRNVIRLGVPEAEAFAMASATPAAYLGLSGELGWIASGARACLTAWNDSHQPVWALCDGVMIE